MRFLLTNQTRKQIRVKFPDLFSDNKTHFVNIEYIISKNNLWNFASSPDETLGLFFMVHSIIENIHLKEINDNVEQIIIYKHKKISSELITELNEYFKHNNFNITNFLIVPKKLKNQIYE